MHDDGQKVGSQSVAVVITAYDQVDYIATAVRSAKHQTTRPREVIVVDDGSNDGTSAVLRSLNGIRVIRQTNAGVAKARNAGLSSVSADFVIFLDGDDILLPRAIEVQTRALATCPSAGYVIGRAEHVDDHGLCIGRSPYPPQRGDLFTRLLKRPWVYPPSSVLFRTSLVRRLGGFDPSLHHGPEDLELLLRVARESTGIDHAASVVRYRMHARSVTKDAARMLELHLDLINRLRHDAADDPALARALRLAERNRRWLWGARREIGELRIAWADHNVTAAGRAVGRLCLISLSNPRDTFASLRHMPARYAPKLLATRTRSGVQ